ncbi:MAG: flippase [Deltaproteobacteria bacterium]|nr:flippase [Deltaproteobacteria bacterium]
MSGPARGGNLLALLLSRATMMGSAVVIQVILARWLGPESFGLYGFIMSLVSIFGFAAHLNMQILIARDVARDESTAPRFMTDGMITSALLSVGAGVMVVGYAIWTDGRQVVVASSAVAAVSLALLAMSNVPNAVFQGLGRNHLVIPSTFASKAVGVAATLGFLIAGMGLLSVFVAQVIAGVVFVGGLILAWRRSGGALPRWSGIRASVALARASVPFGVNSLFAAIYLQADVLVLAALRGEDEVGMYRAAAVLIIQLPVLSSMLSTAVFPRIAKVSSDPVRVGDELAFMMRVMLLVGLPVAVGGMIVAEPLLVALVGEAYRAAAPALLIMLPVVLLSNFKVGISSTLTAVDRQGWRTAGAATAAFFNLGANFLVIPRWGFIGAAWTTLLTEFVQISLLLVGMRGATRRMGFDPAVLWVVVAAGVMGAVVWGTDGLGVWLRIGLGAVVYGGVGYLVGAWSRRDLARLRSI